jgi:hypothetical protein
MISPGTYNITCYQGATLDKTFTATNDGTAINWTGYTGKLQVRQYVNTTDSSLLTLTTGGGGITTLTNDGKIIITATAAQTGAIPAGNYVYDLELTSGTYVVRIVQGRFTVDGQVTA